ncbi:gamma carbonic anhydrase family protein [Betaproteobacteria bacterium]|nr:gamma carbonic anhydrase family protein [Betaproteobacteria bacterium]GHT97326.1 gamma carbonic anhydrase family protein [Betaproteobacteria bacterium]GHU10278.1 gamma carbonic anhydrase family protein [Betaproteobacteria bacterium]GHU20713.1 gamma carbonic anhydrase family protein [Betaproteobacteria bacterium]GHU31443.1 gamma carbonic anhydrase family protein [Betaproteobacteria bacterium]
MGIYALDEYSPRIGEGCWIAHNATIIGDVSIGRRVNIWYNVVIRGDNDPITIGDDTNIQDGSILHNDKGVPLDIGSWVTVGHMVMLHGCTIGDGTLIGINAVVLNNAIVGKNCLIGANALIPEGKVIPDRSLVVGSPGRVIRELSDDEVAKLHANAHHYVDNASRYQAGFVEIFPPASGA